MEDTKEILQLTAIVKENTEKLLAAHYDDNRETILNSVSWKNAAEKDTESRAALYILCSKQGDRDMTDEQRAEVITNSILTWSQVFGYVNSPRTRVQNLPLILFPFQKKLIRELVLSIERGSDFLIEKSREMGVSWTVLYVFTWYWLFKPGSNFLIGSYKEKLVSDGTIDSMFGKLKYIMDSLPNWILPKGFVPKKHFTRMNLYNPQIDSYITGDTMNSDFGRGARKTAIFFDELGFWDYGKSAWEASSQTTSCRIGNSTPNGYNYYKMLVDSGLHTLRLHWSEHPLKDLNWYNLQKLKESKETVAREVDISYDASRVGVIYNEWRSNVVKGIYPYNPDLPLYVSWDFGRADGTAIIWSQVKDGKLRIVNAYYKTDVKNIDYFVPLVTGTMLVEYQYSYTDEEYEMIRQHGTWKKAVHFGDPSGKNKAQNQDYSVIETLKIYGIHVNTNMEKISHNARRTDTEKLILRGIEMNETKGTQWLDISMLNYSFSSTNVEGQRIVKATATPNHNQYSHMATSFEYLCVGLMNMPNNNEKKVFDKNISYRQNKDVKFNSTTRRLR
jgi:hypothetical protein